MWRTRARRNTSTRSTSMRPATWLGDGSNPSPSTSESPANLTFSIGGARPHDAWRGPSWSDGSVASAVRLECYSAKPDVARQPTGEHCGRWGDRFRLAIKAAGYRRPLRGDGSRAVVEHEQAAWDFRRECAGSRVPPDASFCSGSKCHCRRAASLRSTLRSARLRHPLEPDRGNRGRVRFKLGKLARRGCTVETILRSHRTHSLVGSRDDA